MKKIISRITTALLVVTASLIFVQCGNRPDNSNAEGERDTSTVYLNNQNTSYINEREELVLNLENLKASLDGRIESLDSRIEDADERTAEELISIRDGLTKDRSEVQSTIEGLHNSSQNTWNNAKGKAENLYERVSSKLERWDETLQDRNSE